MAETSVIDKILSYRFNHKYYIEQYNDSYFHIIDMNRSISNFKNKGRSAGFYDDVIGDAIDIKKHISQEDISISRTKRNIKRICLSNDFQYFATWTVSAEFCNRFYIEDVIDRMRKLLKAFQRSNKDFKYIYVLEKHENGAFHFHGLIKGVSIGNKEKDLRIYSRKEFAQLPYYILEQIEKGNEIFHIPFFDNNLGYNTFTKIREYNKCCNYIMKYITKDMCRIASNYIYFSSRGLSKGTHYEVAYIPEKLFENCCEVKDEDTDVLLARVKDIDLLSLSDKELIDWGNIVS